MTDSTMVSMKLADHSGPVTQVGPSRGNKACRELAKIECEEGDTVPVCGKDREMPI